MSNEFRRRRRDGLGTRRSGRTGGLGGIKDGADRADTLG